MAMTIDQQSFALKGQRYSIDALNALSAQPECVDLKSFFEVFLMQAEEAYSACVDKFNNEPLAELHAHWSNDDPAYKFAKYEPAKREFDEDEIGDLRKANEFHLSPEQRNLKLAKLAENFITHVATIGNGDEAFLSGEKQALHALIETSLLQNKQDNKTDNTSLPSSPEKSAPSNKWVNFAKNNVWAWTHSNSPCFIINASAFDKPSFAPRFAALVDARPDAFFAIVANPNNSKTKDDILNATDIVWKNKENNRFRHKETYPVIFEGGVVEARIQKAIDGFGLKQGHKGEIDLVGFGEEIKIEGFNIKSKEIVGCFPPSTAIPDILLARNPELFLFDEAGLEENFADLVNKINRGHYVVIIATDNVTNAISKADALFISKGYNKLFASTADNENSHCNVMSSSEIDSKLKNNPISFKDFGFALDRTPHNMQQSSAVKITGAVDWETLKEKLPEFVYEQELTCDTLIDGSWRFSSAIDAQNPIDPITVKQEIDGCSLKTDDASEKATQDILIKLALEIAEATPDAEIVIEANDPILRAQIKEALEIALRKDKTTFAVPCRVEAAADLTDNSLHSSNSFIPSF